MALGVFVKDIAVTDGWEMQIVRVDPGARFPVHVHESPEFLFILEGELVRFGRRMGPGWASVASAGTVDEDVTQKPVVCLSSSIMCSDCQAAGVAVELPDRPLERADDVGR
jgi:anti-sigma factor ChrR (cupin superfamily)